MSTNSTCAAASRSETPFAGIASISMAFLVTTAALLAGLHALPFGAISALVVAIGATALVVVRKNRVGYLTLIASMILVCGGLTNYAM